MNAKKYYHKLTVLLTLGACTAALAACGGKQTAASADSKAASAVSCASAADSAVSTAAGSTSAADSTAATAAGSTSAADSNASSTVSESEIVGMANPFVEYDSVDEAKKHIDFDVQVPEQIEGFTEMNISVMDGQMFQAVYRNAEQEICIRKQAGHEDISGDYNEYPEEKYVEFEGAELKLRGENGTIRNVTWSKNGYSFSIYSDKGLTEDEVQQLAEQIA
ncbi:MAG: hypothetical protein Q4B22_04770 [Eubacteriales bacterium]|nr:hypothetical protein [Eubacteriales bacterium]